MSGYPHGGMGPPGPSPPIPPRPSAYRQGVQQTYYSQETTESPAWRIPYHETEVLITTVDSTSSPATTGYSETNLSRNSSRRYQQETYAIQQAPPETQAVDSSFKATYSETTEFDPRYSSHNMAVESRGHMETERFEQVSDGMSEGLSQLGWGGMSFYDTSRPSNWTPAPPENVHQDRDNSGLRTIRKEIEPEYEKISMDYYDHFTPTFTPASAPIPSPSQSRPENSQGPSRSSSTREHHETASRPNVPHLSVSDPFPISVDHERYYSDQSNLRESQFPEAVNQGGSDPFYQPPSRSYTSYRRTPRREDEKKTIQYDSMGLPSLSGVLGPTVGQPQEPVGRNSFSFDDEKRLYPSNYNQSSVSINSTHSANIPPSSRYNNSIHRTPSYASIRPDNDNRPQDFKYNYNQPAPQQNGPCRDGIPPPPVRYLSQKQGNKLGEILQEKKMEYVVCEMNRKDDLHRRIQEEARRFPY
ncbi:hypothetical protein TWF481_010093 [Arthrobotrys musiformis]|uniref:Uncharacterized protein n=1 Tax=Arthrobotrys musiformis TaxID=47236 RepID=A0AAV9VZU4_9PEZI